MRAGRGQTQVQGTNLKGMSQFNRQSKTERRKVSLQLWAKLSNSSSFSDMESCKIWIKFGQTSDTGIICATISKWFGTFFWNYSVQYKGYSFDTSWNFRAKGGWNLVRVDVEVLTWRSSLHTLNNCHLLNIFDLPLRLILHTPMTKSLPTVERLNASIEMISAPLGM